MKMIVPALVTALAIVGTPASADTDRAPTFPAEMHSAPEENLEGVDVAILDDAGETIDMAAYVLTDEAVIASLEQARERGVIVRIWQDGDEARQTGAYDIARRIDADHPGLEIRYKASGGPLMHLKGYCVDGQVFRTGSANFSHSGLTQQDNDLLVFHSREACAVFEAKFATIWGAK
jgi:phosphatidylserine/phosphatidylglycerophosphate/cardiolipin synthase-like enzyme